MNCSDLTHGNIIGLSNVKFLVLYIIDEDIPIQDEENRSLTRKSH